MNYDSQISVLELELSLISERIDEDFVTREQMGRHMLLIAQIRELKQLRYQQEHDRFEDHDEDGI